MKTSLTIPLAIAVGGIIIAIAVYFSVPRPEGSTSSGKGNPALVRPVSTTDHILGNPTAPVMIVEYADFDCDYCKGFDDTLHQVIASEGTSGKVAWVFREFPLIEIHPNAMTNALAAECVAQTAGNDAFWKFKSELFAHQPIDPLQYGAYAMAAGAESDAFATCYATASTTLSARVWADRQNAFDIGAQGTPYSIIVAPGKAPIVIDSAYPYDAVKTLVDQALQP